MIQKISKTWIEALLPKIQIKAVFFYATLNFSDLFVLLQLLSISNDIFIFSQRHPDEAVSIFTMAKKKNQILLEKKGNQKKYKRLKSRLVSRIFASLTYQLSLCCLSPFGKKIWVLVIFWKFFFEGLLNAWFLKVSLILNNNEKRLVE